ncbi:hypothetical protein HanIR_Chr14g0674951 [Helianthus annuus]|nr:hypothetical protein HanIR_Chr14g0674951 [Helianthus annuus]
MKVSQSLGPPSLPFTLLIRSSHLTALMKCARIIFLPTSPISKHSLLYLVIKSSTLSWSLRHMFKHQQDPWCVIAAGRSVQGTSLRSQPTI